eukprot:2605931-Prymnesium_polylepis.1
MRADAAINLSRALANCAATLRMLVVDQCFDSAEGAAHVLGAVSFCVVLETVELRKTNVELELLQHPHSTPRASLSDQEDVCTGLWVRMLPKSRLQDVVLKLKRAPSVLPHTVLASSSVQTSPDVLPRCELLLRCSGPLKAKLRPHVVASSGLAQLKAEAVGSPQHRSRGAFKDKAFPTTQQSLGASSAFVGTQITWSRTSELYSNGEFSVNAQDANLGTLNVKWLLHAVAILAPRGELLDQLFTEVRTRQGHYKIRIWDEDPMVSSTDCWHTITVDDFIPCGTNGLPFSLHTREGSSAWIAILEKALAKHFGSYARLEAPTSPQTISQGLELLTGGVVRWSTREGDAHGWSRALERWQSNVWKDVQGAVGSRDHIVGAGSIS